MGQGTGGNYITRSFTKYYYGDQVKDDEMDSACSTDGRDEMHRKFWTEDLKGRDHSEYLDVDGRITFEWNFREISVYWMHLA
jgi:hypothetical protein